MNIGGRITQRLAELGWERRDLLTLIPDLTPQSLSNLICRDSKRSEWDQVIAEALGVDVMWLVYGKPRAYTAPATATHHIAEPHYAWPFNRVDKTRWDALLPKGQELVQEAINNALALCESAGLVDASHKKQAAQI